MSWSPLPSKKNPYSGYKRFIPERCKRAGADREGGREGRRGVAVRGGKDSVVRRVGALLTFCSYRR